MVEEVAVAILVVRILPAEAFMAGVSGAFTAIAAFSSVVVSTIIISTMIVFLVFMSTHGGGIGVIRITLTSRARTKTEMKTNRIKIVSGGRFFTLIRGIA
jgi:hypothetical protein